MKDFRQDTIFDDIGDALKKDVEKAKEQNVNIIKNMLRELLRSQAYMTSVMLGEQSEGLQW